MDERGFTLIEMLIVLMVISVLLIITIPNITKHSKVINEKGCNALINMVQAQVKAYEIEHETIPTITELLEEGYITTNTCPGGNVIEVGIDGSVKEGDVTEE
ncbi:competence type IV pilus major pilin ComGC [Cytobacillus sp. IB215316]|uniref:competence type IV pilus major pilin ComGC n=1 Tax=Cytobacillus sp. IB215316 TaxID=3097354 RepID=UPI002A159FD3|nr:competence type IV pilus major pilin ComGC [Cytobacillus sp. IB215316]MDX8359610.1 competence type IV pilus major pilin ComGC [Cytobacillus sp. IB215316]